jgi:hypothetical protein
MCSSKGCKIATEFFTLTLFADPAVGQLVERGRMGRVGVKSEKGGGSVGLKQGGMVGTRG